MPVFDVLVIGCGFSGTTAARILADRGKKVLVLEKRKHIAGNMFDEFDSDGILVHRYGPHIFHTSNPGVYDFLRCFSDFFSYEHRVLGKIDGKLVPIPFNFQSIDMLFEKNEACKFKHALSAEFGDSVKVPVYELLSSSDPCVREVGDFIYRKVFLNYTAKQWGIDPSKIDKSVIARVPAVIGYDDRYFSDRIQSMPRNGYTELFKNLLNSENITVELDCDALTRIDFDMENSQILFDGLTLNKPVIYTGPADALFKKSFGQLPYRSLEFVYESHSMDYYQPAAVVNYPNEENFTRITEFKRLTGQKKSGITSTVKEYPRHYDPNAVTGNSPFYPVLNPANLDLYKKYKALASRFGNLFLCGRLAEYKYYNMDVAIANAMKTVEAIQ